MYLTYIAKTDGRNKMGLEDSYSQLFASMNANPLKDALSLQSMNLDNQAKREAEANAARLRQTGANFESQISNNGQINPQAYQLALAQNPNNVSAVQNMFGQIDLAGQTNLAKQAIQVATHLSSGDNHGAVSRLLELAQAEPDESGQEVLKRYANEIVQGRGKEVLAAFNKNLSYNPSPLAAQYTSAQAASAKAALDYAKTMADVGKTTAETVNLGSPSPLIGALSALNSGKENEALSLLGGMATLPPSVKTALSSPAGVNTNQLRLAIQSALVGTPGGRDALTALEAQRVAGLATQKEETLQQAVTTSSLDLAKSQYPDDPRTKELENNLISTVKGKVGGVLPRVAELVVNQNSNQAVGNLLRPISGLTQADRELVNTITNGETYPARFNALAALNDRLTTTPTNVLSKATNTEITANEDKRAALKNVVRGIPEAVRYLRTNPEGYSDSQLLNKTYQAKQAILGTTDVAQRAKTVISGIAFAGTMDIAKLLKPLTDQDLNTARQAINLENQSATFYLHHLRTVTAQSVVEHSLLGLESEWNTANGNGGANTKLPTTTILGREYNIPYGYTYKQFVDKILMQEGGDFQRGIAKGVDAVFGDNHTQELLNKNIPKKNEGGPLPPNGVVPNDFRDPYYRDVNTWAEKKVGIPVGLLHATMYAGEGSDNNQVSSSGAKTVYQIIPSTRQALLDNHGVDAYSGKPSDAALAAAYLIKENLNRTNGDIPAAVRQYLLGPNPNPNNPTVQRMTQIAPNYVNRVMNAYNVNTRANPVALSTQSQAANTPIAIQDSTPVTTQTSAPPQLSWGDTILDSITGSNRETETTRRSEDFYALPELRLGNALDPKTIQALAATWRSSPAETASIITHIFPNLHSDQDEKGNVFFNRDGDPKKYAIKPGMQFSDVLKALVSGVGFAGLASGAAALAPTIPLTAAATAFGLASGGEQALQAASGGTFDPGSVALDAASGLIPGGTKPKLPNTPVAAAKRDITDLLGTTNPTKQAAIVAGTPEEVVAARQVLEAQNALGITSPYPPSLVGSDTASRISAVVSSQGQRQTGLLKERYVDEIAKKADEVIASLTSGAGRGEISSSILSTLDAANKSMRDVVRNAYKVARDATPPSTLAVLDNVRAVFEKRLAEVGGVNGLSPLEATIQKLFLDDPTATVGRLKTFSSAVGDGLRKMGAYANESEGLLKLYGPALKEAEYATYEAAGGETARAALRTAKTLAARQLQLQKLTVDLFGDTLEKSLVPAIRTGTTSAIKNQDVKPLQKILEAISPEYFEPGGHLEKMGITALMTAKEMREKVLGVSLEGLFQTGRKGEEFSIPHFTNLYGAIYDKSNAELRNLLLANLPAGTVSKLDNLYVLSKQIYEASKGEYRTGAQVAVEDVVKRADTLRAKAGRVMGMTGIGGIIDGLLSSIGLPIGSVSTTIGGALSLILSKNKTSPVDALDTIFSSSTFLAALKDSITGKQISATTLRNIGASKQIQTALATIKAATPAIIGANRTNGQMPKDLELTTPAPPIDLDYGAGAYQPLVTPPPTPNPAGSYQSL